MEEERALRQRVEAALDTVLTRWVVAEVLRRIAMLPFDCLALFNGAPAGFDTALAALGAIRGKSRVHFDAAVTPGAARIFAKDKIAAVLEPGCVLDAEDPEAAKLAQRADLIVLPTLTLSTAAKIAACIRDTGALRIISDRIISGRRILAAADGVLPQGDRMPDAYKRQAERHLEVLGKYGMLFSAAKDLGGAVLSLSGAGAAAGTERYLPDKVVTWGQLAGIKPWGQLSVARDAIITPLAEETARRQNITIVRKTREEWL